MRWRMLPGGAAAAAGWSTSAVRELCRQTVSDCTTARLRRRGH